MYAPFPRTDLHNAAGHPHFSKHNRRLGKVSHQMQKIIEDIQGKKCENNEKQPNKSGPRILPEESRKRSDPRNDENAGEISHEQRRSRRRKYSKQRENGLDVKEMACQTTVLVEKRDVPTSSMEMIPKPTSKRLPSNTQDDRRANILDDRIPKSIIESLTDTTSTWIPNTKVERLPNTSDERLPNKSDTRLPNTSDGWSSNMSDGRLPHTVYHKLPNSREAEVPITTDDSLPRSVKAPWQRPLPPIPEPMLKCSSSEANIYQKVFDTLKRTKTKLGENDKRKLADTGNNRLSSNFVPINLVSHDIEGRNARNDAARSRYVDIEKISSERKCKSKLKCQNPHFGDNLSQDDVDDPEHIYETIDDDENDDITIGSVKCHKLISVSERTSNFPLNGTPSFTIFTYGRTPSSQKFTSFTHEETYLEPVCEFRDLGYMLKFAGSTCSDNLPSVEFNEPITDFEGYSRDLARSPCTSSDSSTYDETTTTIKATYV